MILGSIVTFNPDVKVLLENISAIYKQLDALIIVDNGSKNLLEFEKIINKKFPQIKIVKNIDNYGIAKALNQSLEYANNNQFTWLLTLDQDSRCAPEFIGQMKHNIRDCSGNGKTLVYCPRIVDLNERKDNTNLKKTSALIEKVDFAITSGSLVNVDNAINIKGFDNDLFIDYVDFDFCIRGMNAGYDIYRIHDAILYHRLGEIKVYKFMNFEFSVTNHNEIRRMYMYRNKVYLYKKYFKSNFLWVLRNILSSFKVVALIIIFEKNRLKKMKYIFKGIFKGIRNDLGAAK